MRQINANEMRAGLCSNWPWVSEAWTVWNITGLNNDHELHGFLMQQLTNDAVQNV